MWPPTILPHAQLSSFGCDSVEHGAAWLQEAGGDNTFRTRPSIHDKNTRVVGLEDIPKAFESHTAIMIESAAGAAPHHGTVGMRFRADAQFRRGVMMGRLDGWLRRVWSARWSG